jgi:hypothetical protein
MAVGRERYPVVREGVKNIFGGLDRVQGNAHLSQRIM